MHDWCSSRLRVEPILVRFIGEVGFCLVLEEFGIFDNVAPNRFGVEKVSKTLNCALSVDLL